MKNKSAVFRSFSALAVVAIAAGIGLFWHWHIKTPELPVPPLKDLAAKHGLQLGNFAIASRLNEKPYRNILTQQFNLALIDNTPNWYFTGGGLRPSVNSFNFRQMDQLVVFARQHHMAVEAHHFIWGEQKWLPDWLKQGRFSKTELLKIMQQHILTVGQHYRGKVQTWSVVNEAFTRQQHLYGLRDWWADNLGPGYIDQAFQFARQADPRAKLLLNDFGDESINSTSNAMYNYIKAAKARGVPIDGIGMQMHIDGAHAPTKANVIQNMRRFGSLGLDVYVTEFDVNMDGVAGSSKYKDQQQAKIYYDLARACIESKVCHSFSILGITDKESWYNYVNAKDPRPLLFDKRYRPKPAFYGLRQALLQS